MLQFAAAVFYTTVAAALGSPAEPFFPQQRNPSTISMEALTKGELVLAGRCLRLTQRSAIMATNRVSAIHAYVRTTELGCIDKY